MVMGSFSFITYPVPLRKNLLSSFILILLTLLGIFILKLHLRLKALSLGKESLAKAPREEQSSGSRHHLGLCLVSLGGSRSCA